MLINKKLNSVVTELFIRGRKLKVFLVFITQSYFAVPKNIRLNSAHYFIMKISNKLYKSLQKCTAEPYFFSMIDATLASDNPSCFRENLLERIWKLIMTIDDKIRDEKLQYDVKREAAKISALSFGKTDKYDILQVKKYYLLIEFKLSLHILL